MITRSVPSSTESPGLTLMAVTLPSLSALMLFSIFMASRMTTVWPFFTDARQRRFDARLAGSGGRFGHLCGLCGGGSGRLAYDRFYNHRFGLRRFLHFYFIMGAVHFHIGNVVFHVSDGYLVEVSVDFVFIFFHCLILLLKRCVGLTVISYAAYVVAFRARCRSSSSTVNSCA